VLPAMKSFLYPAHSVTPLLLSSSPDKGFLPPNFYRLELAVIPLWGFYANLLAQILSQTTSHVLLHYHRLAACQKAPQIESVVSATTESDSDDREAPPMEKTPSSASYDVPPVGTTSRKRVAIASIVAGLTVVLTVLGCILPSYSFDYRGLVGVAIESGMDFGEALKSFSVISTAQNLMDQARSLGSSADVFGMLLFASVLVMTVLVVPVALVGCLLTDRLASGGMRPTGANRLGVAIEILQAWQYTEVYLLSVVLAVWQFSDVSTILCDGLSGLFSMLVSSGVLDPSDAQCFQAQASLQAASYLLLGASIFLYLLSKLTKREEEAGVGIGDR
jgi:Paraquat-inducible protein A